MSTFQLNFLHFLDLTFLWIKDLILLMLHIFVFWSTPCQYKSLILFVLSSYGPNWICSLRRLKYTIYSFFSKVKFEGFIKLHLGLCFLTSPRIFSLSGSNTVLFLHIYVYQLYNGMQEWTQKCAFQPEQKAAKEFCKWAFWKEAKAVACIYTQLKYCFSEI